MCFFGTGSSVLVGEIESKPPQVSKVTIVASETLRAGIQYPYHASMRVNQRLTLTLKLTLTLSLRLKLPRTLSLRLKLRPKHRVGGLAVFSCEECQRAPVQVLPCARVV